MGLSGAAAGLLVYAQVGYPLLLEVLGRLRAGRAPAPAGDGAEPHVSLVIAAHREAEVIAAKVANARALDWPARPPRGHRRLRRLARRHAGAGPRRRRRRRARAALGRQGARPGRRGRARPRRAAGLLGRQRALGARRAARARGAVRRRPGRLRLRPGALRQRRRDQPGGPLLALRDGDPRARVAAGARSPRATARSTRCARTPTCASTRSWATTCRCRSTWSSAAGARSTRRRRARRRRWSRPSRASSRASGG